MVFVSQAFPIPGFSLRLTFTNGEWRLFNVRPYLDKGVFRQLQNFARFSQVRVVAGTLAWPGQFGLCPDTLYKKSELLQDEQSA
jgi:hypothetical protein